MLKKEKLLSNIDSIPPVPLVVFRIMELVDDGNTCAGELASIIENDAGLSSRVLRIANSAFYGLSSRVDNLQQAVVILGFSEIRNLTLSVALLQHINQLPTWNIIDPNVYWRHCLAVASAGRLLAGTMKLAPDNAFTLGILHELGRCALACYLPEQYAAALNDGSRMADAAEKHHCGLSQAEAGALLCRHWKLPSYMADAIEQHAQPSGDSSYGQLLFRANCLAVQAGFSEVGDNLVDYSGYWPETGLPSGVSEDLVVELLQAVDEVERLFLGFGWERRMHRDKIQ